MALARVRFVGGPADGLVRELPAGPDGAPPARWIMRRPDQPADSVADHLYELGGQAGTDGWTMRFVRTEPFGATE
ncbi:hypothetical protein AB0H28_11150 [Micromonospora sp. NPDC050980]|uniref:hypothetical protein n=1 Tax=Micromonospora sp. NPDC050980 TaxID=3155161 RepID=UPI0033F8F418